MTRSIILLICCLLFLTGCLEAREKSQNETGVTISAQELSDRRGPVKHLDPNFYYASKYDSRAGIYCGADPELHDLSSNTLQKFATLDEAQEIFPQNKLFRPCDQLG